MSGHWFCSHCDDVVNLPMPVGRWDTRHGVKCPACRRNTADWINDTPNPVSQEAGAKLFQQIKEQIK